MGDTKVTPVWNGGGTVLLTIVNSNFKKASNELVQLVQETIDPTQDASGKGFAPIGHIVTVKSAEESAINVTTSITYEPNYSFDTLKTKIEEVIETYLSELRESWGDNEYLTVRSSQIDARLLDITGIIDIQNTYANGVKNYMLARNHIPIVGSVIDQ